MPYTQDGFRAIWRRARLKAGVEDFRFHDTRHTTASRLRQAGEGLDVIQDVLGHATPAMARRYAHLGDNQIRDAMSKLTAVASPLPDPTKSEISNVVDFKAKTGE